VFISANKLALYPESVPQKYRRAFPERRNVQVFRKAFEELGVHYFDSSAFLESIKAGQQYPLFARSAAHWNSVAGCLVAARLTEVLGDALHKQLQRIDCGGELTVKAIPAGPDRDLTDVINVWDASPSYIPMPYLEAKAAQTPDRFTPKLLFIGTSFLWSVFDVMEKTGVYDKRDFYYYATTNHKYRRSSDGKGHKSSKHVSYSELDLAETLLEYDALVIEINEARIHQIGFAFLSQAAEAVKKAQQGAAHVR
jgi:hypothetical protein